MGLFISEGSGTSDANWDDELVVESIHDGNEEVLLGNVATACWTWQHIIIVAEILKSLTVQ